MVVAGRADGGGEELAGGVDCLPDLPTVDSPGDLLDEGGRQLLVSQFLVDAKEVDLSRLDLLAFDLGMGESWDINMTYDQVHRDGGDEPA